MIITFFLGNGFDLGLGLKTSYTDFYKVYRQPDESDSECIKQFKQQLEPSGDGLFSSVYDWGDFEQTFGEYARNFNEEQKEDYLEIFHDFSEKFNAYLEEEAKLADYSNKTDIEDIMAHAVESYYHLKPKEQQDIESIYRKFSRPFNFQFVTFNYTPCADICVKILKGCPSPNRSTMGCLHIHGHIEEGMILGLNDPLQINNQAFSADESVIREITKPQQIDIMGSGSAEMLQDIINKSTIICVYGMSIGKTDKIWWEAIGKWLQKNNDHRLIILTHIKDYTDRFPYKRNKAISNCKRKFIELAGIPGNISQQIIIGINHDIFAMNLRKEESEIISPNVANDVSSGVCPGNCVNLQEGVE